MLSSEDMYREATNMDWEHCIYISVNTYILIDMYTHDKNKRKRGYQFESEQEWGRLEGGYLGGTGGRREKRKNDAILF